MTAVDPAVWLLGVMFVFVLLFGGLAAVVWLVVAAAKPAHLRGEMGERGRAEASEKAPPAGRTNAVYGSDGERLWHYEWNGHLWCDREYAAFDWETGDVECPHCGDEFRVHEPDNTGSNGIFVEDPL